MAYTEYTERPDICALTLLPDGRVKIDLRENITETSVESSVERTMETSAEPTDTADQPDMELSGEAAVPVTVWSAQEWSLVRYPRRGLEEDVRENFAAYLAEAKGEAEAAAVAAECAAYEREMTKNLAGMLLDMDFRLMMLEEMGGNV